MLCTWTEQEETQGQQVQVHFLDAKSLVIKVTYLH